jgi:hypothetical protein
MIVVVFTKNNARVLKNPKNLIEILKRNTCLIDPDLSKVSGMPPHYWKLFKGKTIISMNGKEMRARDADISKVGADNFVHGLDGLPEKPGFFKRLISRFKK